MIAGFVEFGIVASMQPAFDRLWGGAGRMYAQRLGVARSLESNPMGAMHGVGVALAFGSDSPVTPLDPWGSVRAACAHHNPAQRMSVAGGVRRAHPGRLAGGAPRRRGRAGAGRAGDVRGVVDPGGHWAAAPGVAVPQELRTGDRRRCRCAAHGAARRRRSTRRSEPVRRSWTWTRRWWRGPGSWPRRAGQPVVDLARSHTTVSVERAVLRLAGVTGADPDGIPWVNRLVDAVVADVGLGHGVALPVFDALAREGDRPT